MASGPKHLIKENDHILLKREDNSRLFKLHRNRDVWVGKVKFTLDGVIGHPYGSSFEVKDKKLVRMEKAKPEVEEETTDKGQKDNRNLHDSHSNQKLTAVEIDQMKKEGVTGNELIGQLIENSATFQNKTEFSQEKWVKKKKKKHLMEFTILKPNPRLMCNIYVAKDPARICNLRTDSLAQILTLGNVHAHSTVAVFDTCIGLVTGAVLERLGGFGKVVSFYYGSTPMKSQLEAYDFPKEVMDTLYHFPLDLVNSLAQGDKTPECESTPTSMEVETDTNTVNATPTDKNTKIVEETDNSKNSSSENVEESPKSSGTAETESNSTKLSDTVESENVSDSAKVESTESELNGSTSNIKGGKTDDDNRGKGNKKSRHNKKPSYEERQVAREARSKDIAAARNVILQKNIDCLIIASKFHPTPIVTALLDYVAPSRQVVVFSQFREALQDCYVQMRDRGGLVNFRLSETWLRNYQILPNRTHPVIQMSGTGGYLLTATTVIQNT